MSTAKDVVNKDTGEITEYNPAMFEEEAGIGSTEMGIEDMAMPFLKALAPTDKVLKSLPEAKPGDILNTATMEVFKGEEGIRVIPCVYQRIYIHWAPRGEGTGAPIAIYTKNDVRPKTVEDPSGMTRRDMVTEDGVQPLDGSYIEETHQHFVIQLLPNGGTTSALVAMKSTQLKKSRKWNSMVGSRSMPRKDGGVFTPARYSHIYKLATLPESNKKGDWYGWSISLEGPIPEDQGALYHKARAFFESVSKGDVVVKHEDADGKAAPEGGVTDDGSPF